MRISVLARIAGIGVETVRFYERKGLIDQPRKPANGGYRSYPQEAMRRIQFIRQAQDLGFSLGEIEDLLSLRADPSANCTDVRARARNKLSDVEEKITRLTAIRTALHRLVEACPGSGPAARCCSILEALEPEQTSRKEKGS